VGREKPLIISTTYLFALVKLIRICEWHSLLHPLLHSSLSFLAHALWDLPSSWSPRFLEASAARRKLNEKDRALCRANAGGRRRDNEMGGGSAHALPLVASHHHGLSKSNPLALAHRNKCLSQDRKFSLTGLSIHPVRGIGDIAA
jgi:hypothetical protein